MSPSSPLFQDVFHHHAATTPTAPAVRFGDRALTYAELADRADRLAAALLRRGVRRDDLVGVAARPSLELAVSILGILRAGAAWLPLDPAYPGERLRYMVTDAKVGLLLADGPTGDVLSGGVVDVLSPTAGEDPEGVEFPEVGPEDLAYVIYTSGSTGRPKGVQLTHGGLANLAAAQLGLFDAGPGARVLQFAPTSFDASVFEIAMALGSGAELLLAPRDAIAPGPGLADFLRAHRVTHVTLPPSVLATVGRAELPELRVLVCAGEALPEPLAEQWSPGRRMFNAYGPTETTVWASTAEVVPGGGKPGIGTAIPGATAHVLDEQGRLVPAGTAGELAIGGAGVARGYLDRPELTAEKFIDHPVTGERLYRTGDRVVQAADGTLDFLGRVDHQVKLRGFRIEPGEVAAELVAHPAVTDSVVLVRDDGAGERLVGYAVADGVTGGELVEHLRGLLPAHMVPSAVVVLPQMPLSPSGKIDRTALPAPEREPGADYVEPSTPTERALAEILVELLGLPRVGAHDDFFDLGGHSLLAGRYAARVRSSLGRELPLGRLYETRTVAATAALLDAGDGSGEDAPAVPPITAGAVAEGEPVALAHPQERIWFLESLSPGNLAYNAQATIRLRGPLDIEALGAALDEVVRRQAIYRTAFLPIDGRPMQVVHPPMPVPLPVLDLTDLPEDAREERAEAIVRETVADPFDLAAPPLARWVLVRLADDDHSLIHVEHHLVHDGWSYGVFLNEVQELYTATVTGQPSPLPELPVSYVDFAAWQRDWMRGDVLDRYLGHWTKELAGAPAALDLPTDRPRPASQSFAGRALNLDLPGDLCQALRAYSHARGVTLYSTMLAGFAAVVSRYAQQDDVVVGSGVANRRLADVEQVIGMIVNTLALRVRLDGEPTFDELVRRTHETVGRANEWQDMPLDKLVNALPLRHDPSRNPLFQVMFSFHDSQVPSLEFAGLTGTVKERHNNSAKTDINVVVIPRAEQRAGRGLDGSAGAITLIWEYATDLFDESTMRLMVQRFQTLLRAAVAAPHTPASQLPLTTDADEARLVAAATGDRVPFPDDRTIAELFAEQVAADPAAVAVVDGAVELTYAELDDRAGRIATLLRERGVDRETPVGVMLDRGHELLTVLLAVAKAGGAYVPLDPGYPQQRLRWMLADADAPVVVTRSGLRDRLGARTGVLAIDEWSEALAAAAPWTGPTGARADTIAYTMFTSGSTGRPKGVQVPHRAIARLVKGSTFAAFGPGERFAQVADASFDALTFELWGALLNGGAVCVIPSDELLAPGGLGRALKAGGVTGMFLTSALFTEVMAGHPDSFSGLRTLMVGGDALNVGRVRALLALDPALRPDRLVNGYGPTETTTFAVCHHIEHVAEGAPSVPIGRPIANTTAHVLDARLRPVPDGVPGELYLGGPGVARGYANRPALTADRFLPDPFAADGSRLYRTGDRVRRLGDGTIEFLGRVDDQVKIRGFRIEPGEVESALGEHPGLAQVAVVVDEPPSGKRLVAYTVARPGAQFSPTALREFLADRLPPHLVPAVFVELPELPLTASGKLDRRALPAVGDERPASGDFVAPRPGTETEVADLVAAALGLARVGARDDFFALGGHSLLAMRLVARINEMWSCDVALRDFLHTPTVARLAERVEATRGGAGAAAIGAGPSAEELLLDRLDELTDEEVDALLRETELNTETER
ncbi:amino acid adenylation domain-containing protein [Actinokineospora sp. PR83]|uniref:non-ribosomal peptide synthetase n=1 Tax=Actinokineospora sp. PR83 TaxID=2884908 RepID=UPI001F2382F0|nr:non-ribosomal peptide synthetase [Actinokineospora sp. PR83]MCG8916296.1 amino acid adenylation domain-containing protein [Actinokineospora sp. PR83]